MISEVSYRADVFICISLIDYDKLRSCAVCLCFDTHNDYIYIDYCYYFKNCLNLFQLRRTDVIELNGNTTLLEKYPTLFLGKSGGFQ